MPRGYELKGEDDRPEEEKYTHQIMASNFLIGIAHFLEVRLPERWRLATGRSLPEVNRTQTMGESIWVVDGHCTYVMYDESALKAYELQIRAYEGKGRNRLTPDMTFMKDITVGGHQGRVDRGQVYQGLFRRKSMPMVSVGFSCPYTKRSINVDLRGQMEGEDLDTFLESLRDLVCH